jgi:hypothetical protein
MDPELRKKLARILRTEPAYMEWLERKMSAVTGQVGVMEDIVRQNEEIVTQTLSELGLARSDSAVAVRNSLMHQVMHLDQELYNMLGRPDLRQVPQACETLFATIRRVYTPPRGLFIKHERAIQLLEKFPPQGLLEHFGYANLRELFDKEGFASVMASLRFTQKTSWMHEFFDVAYGQLTANDFEEREVELVVLDPKWLDVAEKFLEKKYHNVSHLKEFGVIFIIPLSIDTPGETLRMFTLILHYLHEVPFYSRLFRKHLNAPDFTDKLKSLLRGDVPPGPMPDSDRTVWRIIQRYLAKDNPDDFRLFEAHVSPEANHWLRAEEDLGRLSRMLDHTEDPVNIGWWTGLDFVGDFFSDTKEGQTLVSFDLIDLLMGLVDQERRKYLYHQQEALWNKIFIEYIGSERLERHFTEDIFDGFIYLE